MIKIEHIETYGWEAAIRGMRNPLNSGDKSDSGWRLPFLESDIVADIRHPDDDYYVIGKEDAALMESLVAAGSDHGKFLRMIGISMDITAPLYWWKEYDTYKVGTVANSCSTMHKIHEKEFTLEDFSYDHLNEKSLYMLNDTIKYLNAVREAFLDTKYKDYWWQMIQLLPSSYNQRRTVTLNYAVARNQYHARKAHKLDEWHDYCKALEGLPYAELITMEGR